MQLQGLFARLLWVPWRWEQDHKDAGASCSICVLIVYDLCGGRLCPSVVDCGVNPCWCLRYCLCYCLRYCLCWHADMLMICWWYADDMLICWYADRLMLIYWCWYADMLMLSNATGSGHMRIGAMAMMDFCDLQDCQLESLVWQRSCEIDARVSLTRTPKPLAWLWSSNQVVISMVYIGEAAAGIV